MNTPIFLEILFNSNEKRHNFKITAMPSDRLKNVKTRILVEVRKRGIMLYNPKLVTVVGMNKGDRARDIDNKVLLAYQVFWKAKFTFCHFDIKFKNNQVHPPPEVEDNILQIPCNSCGWDKDYEEEKCHLCGSKKCSVIIM